MFTQQPIRSALQCLSFASALTLIQACSSDTNSKTPITSSSSTTPPTQSSEPNADNLQLSGGETTVFVATASAFENHSANLTDARKVRDFNIGNDFFKNPWVPNRSSTSMRDGLGPHFNNNACQDCHIRDGRGHAPNVSATENGTDFSTILIRAAKTDISDTDREKMLGSIMANVGDSVVGGQIQSQANAGIQQEASLRVSYENIVKRFDDGFEVTLRKPLWHLKSGYESQGYDFDSDTVFSARIAPPVIGLGLLELIPEADILAQQDIQDSNGDGISGKANYVWSIEQNAVALGRFGWKAGQPTVKEQSAGAFLGDMGLTSTLHPIENCMPNQLDCQEAPTGNGDSTEDYEYEVSDTILTKVAFYSSHLAVPARRTPDAAQVQEGQQLFTDLGCVSCHAATYITGISETLPELSEQVIYPYSDMLLHDMGPELADFTVDNQPVASDVLFEYLATATEWRTPPLWGLGLTKTVDPKATFLHDGRARTILEAVLWHGGEAQATTDGVLKLNSEQREALVAFLNDL